ncbi:MAG: hypothetical protein ACLFRA_08100, partial [Alphaproteobacteria bacterium]
GAGKSSFVANPPVDMRGLSKLPFLNPDSILTTNMAHYGSESLLEALRRTSSEMEGFIQSHFGALKSFIVEKVMPTLGFIGASFSSLQSQGWNIATIVIGLNDVNLSQQRVHQRVGGGGHDAKLLGLKAAFSAHMRLLPRLMEMSDFSRIYDNSGYDYELLAQKFGAGEPLRSSDFIVSSRAYDSPYLHKLMQPHL